MWKLDRNKLWVVCGIAVVSIFCAQKITSTASAQTTAAIQLAVNPPVAYLQVKQGETRTHTIKIQNQGDRALTITPTLVDFATPDETNRVQVDRTHTFPYLATLEQEPTAGLQLNKSYTLPPSATQQLSIPITVPASAPDQEFHLTIMFASSTTTTDSGTIGAVVNGSIGSNLVVMVGDTSIRKTPLVINKIDRSPLIDSFAKLTFKPLVQNPHFHSQVASGSAELKNWRGQTIEKYQIYPDIVLAYDQRQLRGTDPIASLSAQPFTYDRPFLFGPYTFNIRVVTSQPDGLSDTTTQQITVFAFPLVLTGALVLSGMIWIFYLLLARKYPIGKHF